MKNQDEATALLREAGAAGSAPPGAPRLVMLAGPDLGQRIDLAEGELTIGRESRCGVVLPLGGVSRIHCSIRRDTTGLWLRDLGSTNGTRRNGESVPAHQDVRPDRRPDRHRRRNLQAARWREPRVRVSRPGLPHDGARRPHAGAQPPLARGRARERDRTEPPPPARALVAAARRGPLQGGERPARAPARRPRAAPDRRPAEPPRAPRDCTARYGGDEFAVVLAETALSGAMIFAERVRGAVQHEEILVDDERIEVTVSVGVAEWSPQMGNPEDLIALADTALYRAKDAGRNRVAR